jgi:hypothetical protein
VKRQTVGSGIAALVLGSTSGCSYTPSALETWPEEPSCGRHEESASDDQRRKNRCLLDAFAAGSPAELIVTSAPIDGGPITTYIRVLGHRRVEVFIDSTKDSEGSQRWVHLCATRSWRATAAWTSEAAGRSLSTRRSSNSAHRRGEIWTNLAPSSRNALTCLLSSVRVERPRPRAALRPERPR